MAEAARREDWPRTIEEFEAWHARQPERWEFIDGHPRLMAPASMKQSSRPTPLPACTMRSWAPPPRSCGRPPDPDRRDLGDLDVVVTCSAIDLSTPVIAEPVIIVEVMSPSSEADDAGRKWFSYRKIPSLRHYLVLSQDERVAQVHSRTGDLWRERFIGAGAIELDDPPLRLEIEAIYAGTDIAA